MIHKTELVKNGALWVLRPKQPEPEPQPLYQETEPPACCSKLCLWNDIGYGALLEFEDDDPYCVEFTVCEIVGATSMNESIFRLDGTMNDTTMDHEEAGVYMHGSIKLDGCSNMHYDAQDTLMLHYCGRDHLKSTFEMLHRLYDEAGRIMEREDDEDFKR